MRDSRKNMAKSQRRRRRVMLAVIILAGSPVMADGPQRNSVRGLPPLPLRSTAGTNLVHSNPFCEPTQAAGLSSVRQASGSDASSIRLKPIGKAIGLHSIDRSVPTAEVHSPAMTIENVGPAAVRNNPLVESTHHINPELVDTNVVDRASTKLPPNTEAATSAVGASTILLIPPAPAHLHTVRDEAMPPTPAGPADVQEAFSDEPECIDTPESVGESEPAGESELLERAQPLVEADPIQLLPNQPVSDQVNPQPDADVTEQADREPVFFSLSDESEMDSRESAQAPARHDVVAAEPIEVAEVAKTSEPEQAAVADHQHIDLNEALGALRTAAEGSVALGVVEPMDLDESLLFPIDSATVKEPAEPITIYRSEPPVVFSADSPEATLHTKRYRPPVAVKPVPLVFERPAEASDSQDRPTVQPVKGLSLNGSGIETASNVALTPLHLSRAQVRSLTVGGTVRAVKVADKDVCQAFAAGPNQLKLIGTGNGVTRLVVWADADDASAPTRMRTFEVHVSDAVETNGDAVGNKTEMLDQSIRKAFPQCSVRVKAYHDRLVVAGRCDSETSAKQIIRMVRKTCLVPVQDQLVVQ